MNGFFSFKNENKVEIRAVIKFLFLKGFDNVTVHSEIQSVYGDNCVTLRTIENRRLKFEAKNYSIFDLPRDGRPRNDKHDNEILNMLQEDPFIKTREIAEHCNIDKNTVKSIIYDHLHYHRVNF